MWKARWEIQFPLQQIWGERNQCDAVCSLTAERLSQGMASIACALILYAFETRTGSLYGRGCRSRTKDLSRLDWTSSQLWVSFIYLLISSSNTADLTFFLFSYYPHGHFHLDFCVRHFGNPADSLVRWNEVCKRTWEITGIRKLKVCDHVIKFVCFSNRFAISEKQGALPFWRLLYNPFTVIIKFLLSKMQEAMKKRQMCGFLCEGGMSVQVSQPKFPPSPSTMWWLWVGL